MAVAGGGWHSVALRADGAVVAWGWNEQTNVPAGLINVVAIAAGWAHSMALKADGTVVAWGSKGEGETSVPAGLTNVVAIGAGAYYSLALKIDGTVTAWGSNGYGQTNVPEGLNNVVAVAGSAGLHGLALKADGTVVAWGRNDYGQANVPADVSNIVTITGGGFHSLAILGSGAPVITVRPFRRTVILGSAVALSCMAVGEQPLSYQWRLNGANIIGATGASLTIDAAQSSDVGDYSVVVNNRLGSVVSGPYGITVIYPTARLTEMALGNGMFQFVLNVPVGSNYVIQTSSNLVNWLPLSTHTIPAGGAVPIFDAGSINQPRRFYRAVPHVSAEIISPATSGEVSAPFIITNDYIYQVVTTVGLNGGRAAYNFTIATAGNYVIEGMVSALDAGENSFFVNMDAEPEGVSMLWDIPPTSGFQPRTVSWFGNGPPSEFVPKVFNLGPGQHQLIIRGREANTLLQSVTISPYP